MQSFYSGENLKAISLLIAIQILRWHLSVKAYQA